MKVWLHQRHSMVGVILMGCGFWACSSGEPWASSSVPVNTCPVSLLDNTADGTAFSEATDSLMLPEVISNCNDEVQPAPANCKTSQQTACIESGVIQSLERFGAQGSQFVLDVAYDIFGNTYMTGAFDGAVDFGTGPLVSAGSMDMFIAKFDRMGTPVWAKRFGGAGTDQAHRMAVDKWGNILINGHFRDTIDFGGGPMSSLDGRDAFVAKFSSAGVYLWSRRFGGADEQFGRGVAVDQAGNVYAAGTFWNTVDFGMGPVTSAGWDDIYLVKLDPQGKPLWVRRFGDAETQEVWDLAVDSNGNVLMTGYVLGNVDFGNGILAASPMPDAIAVKVDPNGTTLWSRRFGGAGIQYGQSIAVNSDTVVIGGAFEQTMDLGCCSIKSNGGMDAFLVALNDAGNPFWTRRFGDNMEQSEMLVAFDGVGDLAIAGSFQGEMDLGFGPVMSSGDADAFVAKLNHQGEALWGLHFGDASVQKGWAVAADKSGAIAVGGPFYGTISMPTGTISSTFEFDIFVMKFAP